MLIFCTGGSKAIPHNSRLTAQAPLRRLRHGICVAKMLDKTSSIICAFGLAAAAPRSPYRHLELCGIAIILRLRCIRKQRKTDISQRQAEFKAKSHRNSLRISRLFNAKSRCVCRNRLNFRIFRYTLGLSPAYFAASSCATQASASSRMRPNLSRAASTGAGVVRSTPAWRSSSSG